MNVAAFAFRTVGVLTNPWRHWSGTSAPDLDFMAAPLFRQPPIARYCKQGRFREVHLGPSSRYAPPAHPLMRSRTPNDEP